MNHEWSALHLLQPLNKEEEKRKFLFDTQYNPQFVYDHDADEDAMETYGSVSNEHLPLATSILKKCLKLQGDGGMFSQIVKGEKIDRQTVEKRILEYLQRYGLDRVMVLRFSKQFLSPTSVIWPYINIRLPIVHRDLGITHTLHHEIATHVLRRLNDERQPWWGKRAAYHLTQPSETEEGLAVINGHVFRSQPLLWHAALYYYAVYQGSRMSFGELYNDLRQYVRGEESRWSTCVRVKRGVRDTSVPGAFPKDQIYLRGAIVVLRWLKDHDFDPRPLYQGKIAVEDLEVAHRLHPQYAPILPEFLQDEVIERYKKGVRALIKKNGLSHML